MIWTVELAAALDDAPFPATREELIEWAERNGLPQQLIDNLYELDEIEEGEDTIYEGIEDIWPDYIRKEDFFQDRKSTRLNSSHVAISYAVFCLKKKSR